MCEPATLSLIAAGIGAAGTVYSATQKGPKMPEAPAPEKLPQQSKAPDAEAFRRKNQGGLPGIPGAGSTLLTGSSGIDPGTLNVGRNTLLGG